MQASSAECSAAHRNQAVTLQQAVSEKAKRPPIAKLQVLRFRSVVSTVDLFVHFVYTCVMWWGVYIYVHTPIGRSMHISNIHKKLYKHGECLTVLNVWTQKMFAEGHAGSTCASEKSPPSMSGSHPLLQGLPRMKPS
eukprot:scaffold227550_cov36-Prasinocladus_malaysianus.AAC.1